MVLLGHLEWSIRDKTPALGPVNGIPIVIARGLALGVSLLGLISQLQRVVINSIFLLIILNKLTFC
jgi:hypothetical protein